MKYRVQTAAKHRPPSRGGGMEDHRWPHAAGASWSSLCPLAQEARRRQLLIKNNDLPPWPVAVVLA
ncbi:MAG: hypothetical protein KatS3mg111_3003 [Pirellulaceae bacterium]|nr:MAG: hypothetical protein KatS3mg111_3003 [Pirellulaceae bacterium]